MENFLADLPASFFKKDEKQNNLLIEGGSYKREMMSYLHNGTKMTPDQSKYVQDHNYRKI